MWEIEPGTKTTGLSTNNYVYKRRFSRCYGSNNIQRRWQKWERHQINPQNSKPWWQGQSHGWMSEDSKQKVTFTNHFLFVG